VNHTKERILDTAERLFAEQGYAATSLRGIIAEAGVNLAAVHYHFPLQRGAAGSGDPPPVRARESRAFGFARPI
jgi:hypothetical protein